MTDIFTKEKRSELMRKVRNKDTNIEIIVRKTLFNKGYRYRVKNSLFGKPDIIFADQKIAIFCDGDFWHGKNFDNEKKGYKPFWVRKIKSNIDRDKLVKKTLTVQGWKVLRFWKSEILKDIDECILLIEKELKKQQK